MTSTGCASRSDVTAGDVGAGDVGAGDVSGWDVSVGTPGRLSIIENRRSLSRQVGRPARVLLPRTTWCGGPRLSIRPRTERTTAPRRKSIVRETDENYRI